MLWVIQHLGCCSGQVQVELVVSDQKSSQINDGSQSSVNNRVMGTDAAREDASQTER